MEKIPKHDGRTIPTEIIHDILLDLPVKTLKRFLCVSKQWHSLISSAAFQRDHYLRGLRRDPLLLLTSCENDGILHLATFTGIDGDLVGEWSQKVRKDMAPIQSCHGLVCFTQLDTDTEILICNPATREIFDVPPGNGWSISAGFGYVDSTKEFKVVRFFYRFLTYGDRSSFKSFCEVFTLGSSGWREAKQPPDNFPRSSWPGGAPFVNGAIHVLPFGGVPADDAIHAFHIESEEYNTIGLPDNYFKVAEDSSTCTMTKNIQELRGSLYLIFSFGMSITLWLLEDYENGKWVQKYEIDLSPVGSRDFDKRMVILGDGTVLLNVISERFHDLFYRYNPLDKSFQQKSKDNCAAILYVESFMPVGGIP